MNGGDVSGNAPIATPQVEPASGSCAEVLLVFLRRGCTSFGGPIAHLGYFQKEIVERRKWCSKSTMAEIIALAQSLPGPASSQVGFALGILRAGWLGGLAAWVGFTLPSAILMSAFAYGHSFLGEGVGQGLLHGLPTALDYHHTDFERFLDCSLGVRASHALERTAVDRYGVHAAVSVIV